MQSSTFTVILPTSEWQGKKEQGSRKRDCFVDFEMMIIKFWINDQCCDARKLPLQKSIGLVVLRTIYSFEIIFLAFDSTWCPPYHWYIYNHGRYNLAIVISVWSDFREPGLAGLSIVGLSIVRTVYILRRIEVSDNFQRAKDYQETVRQKISNTRVAYASHRANSPRPG